MNVPPTDRPITIVLVDDAADVRAALVEVLRADRRFQVIGTADRADAVDDLARHRPDLALVDVRMPAGGGFEACRRILSSSPATVVVALSAFATPSLVRRMRDAGAAAYLTKGMAGDELLDQLVEVFSAASGAPETPPAG